MTSKLEKNLQEAKKYLPNANADEHRAFAARQFRARLRFARLRGFYGENYCRMTRLHLLAAAAIVLGRFCGVSETFDEIGESLMPVDAGGAPRTEEWKSYADACRRGLPIEVRDELWMIAHFKDLESVRSNKLEEKFYAEAAACENEPIWQLLRQHVEVTLGVRLMDGSAIAGLIPHETAIAGSLGLTVKKLSTAAVRLVARYATETAAAVLGPEGHTPAGLVSYRRTALEMPRLFLLSFTVAKIFRRGIRIRDRGRTAQDESWRLLETMLGDAIGRVDPLIRDFYANPSRFDVTAALRLETLPARIWSRLLTLLLGQGLFETNLREIPARFRVFERQDGSMHFVRELFCDDRYRVFDSDFVVRDGRLYEVFTDLNAAVEMQVEPTADTGLLIQSRRFLLFGRKVPSIGLRVEFKSGVDGGVLRIDGHLQMKPKTRAGRFFAHTILRRPQNLGSIHYVARKKPVKML